MRGCFLAASVSLSDEMSSAVPICEMICRRSGVSTTREFSCCERISSAMRASMSATISSPSAVSA